MTPGITISRGGYLAFGNRCPLDHRGLWFDVEYFVAFGHRTPTLVSPQPKRLKAKDQRVVKKYLKSVKKTMKRTGFHLQYAKFKGQCHVRWDHSLECEYNHLQQESTCIWAASKKNIRKLTMGRVPWLLEIQTIWDKIELWEMLVRRKRRKSK
jgi:hypothetical protein